MKAVDEGVETGENDGGISLTLADGWQGIGDFSNSIGGGANGRVDSVRNSADGLSGQADQGVDHVLESDDDGTNAVDATADLAG